LGLGAHYYKKKILNMCFFQYTIHVLKMIAYLIGMASTFSSLFFFINDDLFPFDNFLSLLRWPLRWE
jgi:hypothetical protein